MSRSSTSSSEPGAAGGAAARGEALATTSPAVLATPARRVAAALAMLLFLLVVYGSAIADTLAPVPSPQLFGFEKQRAEDRRANARFLDGTLAKQFADDLRLHSVVRRTALALYSPLLLRLFGEAGTAYVAGPNDWLFLRDRLRVAARPRDELVGSVAGRLRALGRWFAASGSRLVAVPLPRKGVIESAELPRGADMSPGHDHALAAALRDVGVDFADLLPVWANSDEPAYLPTDTHWSSTGSLLSARAVAVHVLGAPPPHEPTLQTQRCTNGAETTAHVLGLDDLAIPLLPTAAYLQHYLVGSHGSVASQPPADGELPVLLAGTSFSKHSNGESTLFGELLSVFLDRPLWNAARAGITGTQSLADALAQVQGRPLPPLVVVEMPNHYSLCFEHPLSDLAQVCALLPTPRGFASLQHGDPGTFGIDGFDTGGGLHPGTLPLLPRTALFARCAWHGFVYPRDGTLALRLRGKLTGSAIDVTADSDPNKVYGAWTPDRREVVLPIADDRLGERFEAGVFTAAAGTTLELESIEVTALLDLAHGRRGAAAPRAGAAACDGWQQTFTFAPAAPTLDDCIGIAIDGTGPTPAQRTVTATFADGTEATLFGPAPLLPRSRLLLPLGPAARELRTVIVSGAGTAPPGPVRVWQLPRTH